MTHPITPPPELAAEWVAEIYDHPAVPLHSITLELVERAAQWGADQELEACCEWLVSEPWFKYEHEAVEDLRAARRPKPPSLKEQALEVLERSCFVNQEDAITIRLALESIDD